MVRDLRVWVLGALGLLLLVWVVRVVLNCVFLRDTSLMRSLREDPFVVTAEVAAQPGELSRAIFLRCHVPRDRRLELHPIGIHAIRNVEHAKGLLYRFEGSRKPGLLLLGFDRGLKEPQIICRKLELLEELENLNPATIYIESSIEPLYFLMARLQEHHSERATLGIDLERWAFVLQRYLRVRSDPRRRNAAAIEALPFAREEVKRWLSAECAPTGILVRVAKHISRRGAENLDRERVTQRVLDLAQAHYRRIWASCSSEEKLLLHRIASGSLIHRQTYGIAGALVRRGLLLMEPSCRLMNESFRRFVLTAERTEVFDKWQQRGDISVWSRIRAPILAAFAALAIFFFATQREAFHQTLGLLAAITAILPGLISAAGNLTRPRH